MQYKLRNRDFHFKIDQEDLLEDQTFDMVLSNHETVISESKWMYHHMAMEGIFVDKDFDLTNKNKTLYGNHFNREALHKRL